LVVNDLQDAAIDLCPWVGEALARIRDAGAARALVSGSGPTVVGLFGDRDAYAEALHAPGVLKAMAVSAHKVRGIGNNAADS
jgi:4-diphosphocytidyl-2-C-methyl-D-erythritol kinase